MSGQGPTSLCGAGLGSFTQAVLANVGRALQAAVSSPAACADAQECFLQRLSMVRIHIPVNVLSLESTRRILVFVACNPAHSRAHRSTTR